MKIDKCFSYPLRIIESCFYELQDCTSMHQVRKLRPFMPYHFRKINNKYLPLNRDYKPIGIRVQAGWIEYEDFPFLLVEENEIKRKDAFDKEITLYQNNEVGFFLFNDFTSPLRNQKLKDEYKIKLYNLFFGKNSS